MWLHYPGKWSIARSFVLRWSYQLLWVHQRWESKRLWFQVYEMVVLESILAQSSLGGLMLWMGMGMWSGEIGSWKLGIPSMGCYGLSFAPRDWGLHLREPMWSLQGARAAMHLLTISKLWIYDKGRESCSFYVMLKHCLMGSPKIT